MKIALAITSLNAGGAERVISTMANFWASKPGFEVVLFYFSSDHPFYELNSKIKLISIYPKKKSSLIGTFAHLIESSFSFHKILLIEKPDIIISFSTTINVISLTTSLFNKIPVIISERQNPVDYRYNLLIEILRKKVYKKAAAIVLQTAGVQKAFTTKNIKLGNNVYIIPNPISTKFCTNSFEPKKDIILSVGRLTKEKGHDLLIRSFAKTNNKGNFKLIIIGSGIEKQNLIELAKSLGINERVEFLGLIENVEYFMSKASIFVLPSRSEGFPNALCEAMAMGCACISFKCDYGPEEIIESQSDGILVEKENITQLSIQIERLINNSELRNLLSKNSIDIQSRFSLPIIMNKWEKIITTVVSSKM